MNESDDLALRSEDETGEPLRGLTAAEAAERFRVEGPNELPAAGRRPFWRVAANVLREPMILLLLGAGAVYFLLGDPADALVLIASIFAIAGISLYQNLKSERALEALRDLSSPRALVRRAGLLVRIPAREIVRGDLVLLSEGDRVPADGMLARATGLAVDESLLTGESAPVAKAAAAPTPAKMRRPGGGDGLPFVYSGTLVTRGRGLARVLATGPSTEMGRIGRSLASVPSEPTRLQKETARLVRVVAGISLVLCVAVAGLYGTARGSLLAGLLAGVTLAMALIPEEFPVVLTVFLALGAWRLSRRRVLTRRLASIEAVGAATVLCVDKTGTLTENRMSIAEMHAAGHYFPACGTGPNGPSARALLEGAALASPSSSVDPMERAIDALLSRAQIPDPRAGRALQREYPLGPELLAMTRVWSSGGERTRTVATKGAPEVVLELCRPPRELRAAAVRAIEELAAKGRRVLGVARAHVGDVALPDSPRLFAFEWLGLLAFDDPVREDVPAAIADCARGGIRVVLVSGDYSATAASVARAIGLPEARVVTGPELDSVDDGALAKIARDTNVFARVVPEQKLRLVRAFQANGEVVAMTGDGVNDAPALKAADIGIAMGGRGTDVAREAADLVLLDDNFTSLVAAVSLGRRIFDNLRRAMIYLLAVHVPIAGVSLACVLFAWPLLLLPVHILFLELVIDPACSIAFEAEPAAADLMSRPPRPPREPLFSGSTIRQAVLQGAGALGVVLAIFVAASRRGDADTHARALAFGALVAGNVALILANRPGRATLTGSWLGLTPALRTILGGSTALFALAFAVPGLRRLFAFSPLGPIDPLILIAAGIVTAFWANLVGRLSVPRAAPTNRGMPPVPPAGPSASDRRVIV